jgi:hypothetical protein
MLYLNFSTLWTLLVVQIDFENTLTIFIAYNDSYVAIFLVIDIQSLFHTKFINTCMISLRSRLTFHPKCRFLFIDTFVSLAIPSLQFRLTTSSFSNLNSTLKTNTQYLSIVQCRVLVLICSHILLRSCLAQKCRCLNNLYIPRVEAGKNTSTVIPASRKRRRKGNRISLRWDSASRPKRRIMRTYFWISLFTSYRITAN